MERDVILSKRAKIKLEQLLEYLEQNWSVRVKHDFIKKFDKSLKIIQKNPDSFPKTNFVKGLHKCVITKQNTIYYRISEMEIEIITLFDTRQNPEKLFDDL